jgi:hypothetical protein
MVVGSIRPPNFRMRDDAVAPEAAEIFYSGPAFGAMTLEKRVEPRQQRRKVLQLPTWVPRPPRRRASSVRISSPHGRSDGKLQRP